MKTNDLIDINDLDAPVFITWQINAECNLACLHCFEEAGPSMPDKLSREETFKILEQIVDLKVPYVAFSGGEPLLHPYIFEMCEFLRKGSIDLKIETNGEYINQEKAERIARLNLRSVQISLDGATPAIHEKLRLGGNWNKAVNACRLLKSKGVNMEIVFVPNKFNIHEIGQIIDFAYSLGVYGIYTGKIMRIGRAAQNWDILCPSDEQYKTFFTTLGEKLKQYDGKMKVFFYPYDVIEEIKRRRTSPTASLLILPNGKVKLTGPMPFICGDLKKQTIAQVWENYKISWQKPQVQEFIDRLINDQNLFAESNKWVEFQEL